ncbi:unnamed protein product [Pseudo-nitzschia multistriata]|uniref:Uncharacterized protein n=1 Tax=Pseudo-nitzschia multistriata TaxID=183589 RepID=A0A448ZI95_9STRA|nr:unnamed protein product [Pseudo-nitzschia multistriata]
MEDLGEGLVPTSSKHQVQSLVVAFEQGELPHFDPFYAVAEAGEEKSVEEERKSPGEERKTPEDENSNAFDSLSDLSNSLKPRPNFIATSDSANTPKSRQGTIIEVSPRTPKATGKSCSDPARKDLERNNNSSQVLNSGDNNDKSLQGLTSHEINFDNVENNVDESTKVQITEGARSNDTENNRDENLEASVTEEFNVETIDKNNDKKFEVSITDEFHYDYIEKNDYGNPELSITDDFNFDSADDENMEMSITDDFNFSTTEKSDDEYLEDFIEEINQENIEISITGEFLFDVEAQEQSSIISSLRESRDPGGPSISSFNPSLETFDREDDAAQKSDSEERKVLKRGLTKSQWSKSVAADITSTPSANSLNSEIRRPGSSKSDGNDDIYSATSVLNFRKLKAQRNSFVRRNMKDPRETSSNASSQQSVSSEGSEVSSGKNKPRTREELRNSLQKQVTARLKKSNGDENGSFTDDVKRSILGIVKEGNSDGEDEEKEKGEGVEEGSATSEDNKENEGDEDGEGDEEKGCLKRQSECLKDMKGRALTRRGYISCMTICIFMVLAVNIVLIVFLIR